MKLLLPFFSIALLLTGCSHSPKVEKLETAEQMQKYSLGGKEGALFSIQYHSEIFGFSEGCSIVVNQIEEKENYEMKIFEKQNFFYIALPEGNYEYVKLACKDENNFPLELSGRRKRFKVEHKKTTIIPPIEVTLSKDKHATGQ